MFDKMNIAHVIAVLLLQHIFLHGLTAGIKKSVSAHSCEVIGSQEMIHLLTLMDLPHGSTVIIIQDCYIGQSTAKAIDNWTIQFGLVMLSVHISNFDDVMPHLVGDVLSKKTLRAYWSMLNFVVFCDDCLLRIQDMITRTIYNYPTLTLLRHFSKWLFIYMEETAEGIPNLDTVLDNVAIAFKRILTEDNSTSIFKEIEPTQLQVRECVGDTCQTDGSTDCVIIQTLLWKSGARQWSDVGSLIQPSNTMHVVGPLFPNTQFGLNGRKLKIGVMECVEATGHMYIPISTKLGLPVLAPFMKPSQRYDVWTTYCSKSRTHDNESVFYTQVCRDVCDFLSISLNFSYVFVEPPDHSWGERLPNSSWSGLLGMLVRKEIDLSAIPYGQTMERREVLTFSAVIMSSRYQVCYNKKYTERTYWASLISCFKWEVYACGSVVLLWCIGLLSMMELTATKRPREEGKRPRLCTRDLSRIVFTGVSVPLHQGSIYQPVSVSGRILYVSWWTFCIVITAVYTGNLVAFLAVSKEKIPFTTLEELANNEEYGLLVSRGSYIENQLRVSGDSTMKALWEKAVTSRISNFSNSLEEYDYHERLLQSGKYALIEVSHAVDHLKLTISQLRKMSRDVISLPMSLPFPLDSPLELVFSERIRLLYDTGMMDGLERKWSTRMPTAQDEVSSGSQLEIADLQTAFIACAAGVFVASVCLAVEHMCNHTKLPQCRPHK